MNAVANFLFISTIGLTAFWILGKLAESNIVPGGAVVVTFGLLLAAIALKE